MKAPQCHHYEWVINLGFSIVAMVIMRPDVRLQILYCSGQVFCYLCYHVCGQVCNA